VLHQSSALCTVDNLELHRTHYSVSTMSLVPSSRDNCMSVVLQPATRFLTYICTHPGELTYTVWITLWQQNCKQQLSGCDERSTELLTHISSDFAPSCRFFCRFSFFLHRPIFMSTCYFTSLLSRVTFNLFRKCFFITHGQISCWTEILNFTAIISNLFTLLLLLLLLLLCS